MIKEKLYSLSNNDYVFNLINKIYAVLIGLFSSAFITRYLGVQLKGNYAYIMQIIQITALILNLGVYQSYSYFYKKNNGKDMFEKYINIFKFQFLIYVTISGFSIFFHRSILVFLVELSIAFEIAKLEFENVMLVENIRLKIKVHMLSSALMLMFYIILFYLVRPSVVFPIVIIIIIDLVTLFIYFKKMNVTVLINKLDIKFIKNVISFGYLPMITTLLVTLNYSVDILFLKHLSNSIDLGLYATAAGIVNYIWLIPDTFKDVLFSRVARNNDLKPVVLSVKISILVVMTIIVVFAIFGKFAIAMLYGKDFIGSYFVTIILLFGAFSMTFFKIFGVVFLAEGRRYFYFFSLLVSVIVNCLLNYYMIPKYGMYGSAFASVASYTICGVSFLIYFSKIKSVSIRDLILLNRYEYKTLINVMKNN